MEDKELYNPQNGEVIKPKRPKQFWKDWRFYVYTLIAIMLAIVSFSSALTACAAINAGVGQKEDASYSVAQRKNVVTTTEGGYTSYSFSIEPFFGSLAEDTAEVRWYTVASNYDLSLYASSDSSTLGYGSLVGWSSKITFINQVYSTYSPAADSSYFVVVCGYSRLYSSSDLEYWYYSSFYSGLCSSGGDLVLAKSFVQTGFYSARGYYLVSPSTLAYRSVSDYFFLGYEQSNILQLSSGGAVTDSIYYQDIESYYRQLGYSDGYEDGNADGYAAGQSAGYASGYSEGLEVGNSNGEANGYADGYAAGLNASNYFKSITANNGLVFFDILANITPYYTDGDGNVYYYRIFSAEVGQDFYYCWLCYYSTSNWTQWDVYLVWCDQSSSSGFTLDYLKNNSLGVWAVPKSNGAFSSIQSYAVYEPSIKTLDNAKVSLVYNVQMMQAYVTLDGGRTYGDVYKDGYTTGYQNGYNYGYELGETAGINAAEPEALTTTLVAVFQQPFNQIYRFFNFNILGLNVLGLATGLLSVLIIIKVFKKVLK